MDEAQLCPGGILQLVRVVQTFRDLADEPGEQPEIHPSILFVERAQERSHGNAIEVLHGDEILTAALA